MEDLDQTLTRLIEVAVANVPGADYGGITMTEDGALVTRAPSDPRIADLDALQAQLGEGPCVTVQTSGTSSVVQVDDFAEEDRWPRFAPAAVNAGIGSLMSFAMAPHGAAPGAVNLYSVRRAGFAHLDRVLGEAFALHVGVVVYGAHAVANLRRALDTRDMIGQAKGILMERFDLSADQAFDLLVRSSQETNTKLHDVAAWLASGSGSDATTGTGSPRSW
ncbi:GAF and ANTAR domain-containing protein [Pseudonocardia sp. KRD291]|uniref:GAF and ANTAR domain-containing protein n=1 Tax=Pseudonocardia sp. KRD291 TaxID=2792007 RepID=UPI001C4A39D4|nr:GAF and ANTAR domain-containing protein [Pseudonocardia sp. KRD291]MBW0106999.1 GAF and ANTAR domain-containing protein [Pseudonocardia sp. KRD291]